MEHRLLGGSGLKVPVLAFGTATFGGRGDFFSAWGSTDVTEATRLVDICLDHGVTLFDTADTYSRGLSEEILGHALAGKRDRALISTKATFRMDDTDPNNVGSSRFHLIRSIEGSLRRLQTDYIDIYTMHGFDAQTPVEEVLSTLETFVQSGKVRYLACSNFSGWHLMKSLAVSERHGWSRYVGHQAYYSLICRDYEWELMPLALDQNVGTLVWSPLGGGRLSGKIRRGQPAGSNTRVGQIGGEGPEVPEDRLFRVIDALDAVSAQTGKTVAQVALNWCLQRPTVSTLVFGARSEAQLLSNLGAVGWNLTAEQVDMLDTASATPPAYPYWHQWGFEERNPRPVPGA
ncbi:MAG: oxidoreductase [Chloroflexota bacterium]|nr:MAG: oxidoreductase [Chloroflexota bacterium]